MSDQPKRPVETPREWLRYSQDDMTVAEREMREEMPVYHVICFLCQSAAEKALKGYLIAHGWRLEKTHDILKLLDYCADYDDELGDMVAYGASLNAYMTAGRYPGDISFEDIGKANATEALQATKAIQTRVLALMKDEDNATSAE